MSSAHDITILDGPLGTQLLAHGVPTPPPLWSALALRDAPQAIERIHRAYIDAGAQVITTNTFRTQPGVCPDDWRQLTARAVELAQRAVGSAPGVRVAGSIAPISDCYRPDLSPGGDSEVRDRHALLAGVLVDAGVDLLLCETFPHPGEALAAVEAAVATGANTWLALTAGPDANLMTPGAMAVAAAQAVDAGASALLVNCTPASQTLPFVKALASANLRIPIGAYANAGSISERMGWRNPVDSPEAHQRYASFAQTWADAGASLIGSCCGTGPEHIALLAKRFG